MQRRINYRNVASNRGLRGFSSTSSQDRGSIVVVEALGMTEVCLVAGGEAGQYPLVCRILSKTSAR